MKSMSWRVLCGIVVFAALASSVQGEPHRSKPTHPAHEASAQAPGAQSAPGKTGVPRGDLRGDIASNARTHGDPPRAPSGNRPPKP
jgi:hypothetical protein